MPVIGVTPKQRIVAMRPAAWYQFGRGITYVSGKVSQWNDASGNARHLLQATAAARPVQQTDGSILCDGAATFLQTSTFTLAQPIMLYLLFRQVTWASGGVLCDGFTAASGQLVQTNVSPQIDISAGSAVALNTSLAVNTYGIATVFLSGASSSYLVNKGTATTGNAGTTAMAGLTIGADGNGANFGNVQVKEAILFAATHQQTQQYQVINYLSMIGGLGL